MVLKLTRLGSLLQHNMQCKQTVFEGGSATIINWRTLSYSQILHCIEDWIQCIQSCLIQRGTPVAAHATSNRDLYPTSAERVIASLRHAITSGTLPAGSPIRQEEVAAQHNVSRMPVREAFRQLEAEGLLVVYPGRGAFVKRLSAAEVEEIYDIRILLECDALRRALPAQTAPIHTEAETLLVRLAATEDSQEFGKLDEAFHTVLYAPAQRPRLLELINTLRNQVTQFLYVAAPMQTYRDGAMVEHRQILDACQAGDLDAAVAAVETHLRNSVKIVVALTE